jgi:hypothetical protein
MYQLVNTSANGLVTTIEGKLGAHLVPSCLRASLELAHEEALYCFNLKMPIYLGNYRVSC